MLPHEALRVDRLLLRLLEPHQHLDDVLGDARLDQVLPEVGFLWTSRALRTELLSAWWGGRGGGEGRGREAEAEAEAEAGAEAEAEAEALDFGG